MTDALVKFEWSGFGIDDPDADQAVALLAREGGAIEVKPTDEHEFAFIPIVIGAIAVVGLAKAIKGFMDDLHKGVMINAQKDPVVVTKEPNLPRGIVIVVDRTGKVSIEQPDHESLGDLIKAALAAK